MERYFDKRMSAAGLYGYAPEEIIRLMAARFMGSHPAAPFIWRARNENGIRFDDKARVHFDFAKRFPDAGIGQIVYAAGDLYCSVPKKTRFILTCSSPLSVWLNGKLLFRSNGFQERNGIPCEAEAALEKGFNRFLLRSECTAIGFGCTLQNAMPQWEPCHYILPFSERNGEAGFLYTAPVDPGCAPSEEVWKDREEASGLKWLPEPGRTPLREEGTFYAWTAWETPEGCEGAILPEETVLLDGCRPRRGDRVSPGRHEVLLFGTLLNLRRAVEGLPGRIVCPVHRLGDDRPLLVLGPCARACGDPAALARLGALYEDTAWRPDAEGMRLRPYAEVPLFGRWTYPLGVTLYGLLSAGRALEEKSFENYVLRHVRQVTEIQAYALWDRQKWGFPGVNQQLCWLDALDDCGSFGSLMLECDPEGCSPSIGRIADRIGAYMLREQPRTLDGAFCRRDDTVWADDLYMSIPFLCRFAERTDRPEALEECVSQQLKYRDLLFMPQRKVMAHMMCLRQGKNNGIPWSRGNGWVIFSLSELLMRLEKTHAAYPRLLRHFSDLTEGYLALQDENGLWHQILDERETYPESSATAMFICAFGRGVRCGWYPPEMRRRAADAAVRAWKGLTEEAVDREGNLYGVCQGSGFSFSRAYYRTLMWNFNDTHGIGIVMLAGVELMKMLEEEPAAALSLR